MKKALSILTVGCLAVSLAACGSTAASSAASAADSTASSAAESTAASDTAAAADGQTYKVGICQLVQHVALDAATQGFKDALTEQLGMPLPLRKRTPRAIPTPAAPSSMALFLIMLT